MIIVTILLNCRGEQWVGVYKKHPTLDCYTKYIHHDILYIPDIFHLDCFLIKLKGEDK